MPKVYYFNPSPVFSQSGESSKGPVLAGSFFAFGGSPVVPWSSKKDQEASRISANLLILWSRRRGLNPWPADYELREVRFLTLDDV